MRYRDITEAPIADLHVYHKDGGEFADGRTFDDKDKGILTSEKGRAKIVRAFQKTPHVFEVFFRSQNDFNANGQKANDDVSIHLMHFDAGIHDRVPGVPGKPGVIRVLIIGNLSPDDRMPMTAWTLAHKIGHSFFDSSYKDRRSPIRERLTQVIEYLWLACATQEQAEGRPRKLRETNFNTKPEDWVVDKLTMRSARKGLLKSDPSEGYVEVIAQYLITGRVTLRVSDSEALEIVEDLNKAIRRLFTAVEGFVIVEL